MEGIAEGVNLHRRQVIADLVRSCPELRLWGGVQIDPLAAAGEGAGLYRVTPAASADGVVHPASVVARFVERESASDRPGGSVSEQDAPQSYVDVALHLAQAGMAVPHIFGWSRAAGVVLMSDLGDVTLERALASAGVRERATLLRRAVQLLVRLQQVGYSAERVDSTVLRRSSSSEERLPLEGAVELAMRRSGTTLGPSERSAIDRCFNTLLGLLEASQTEVLHGDMRARHIMLADDTLWLVGFDGVRQGPFSIDLASLLLDTLEQKDSSLEADLVSLYADERRRGRLGAIDEDVLWDSVGAAQILVCLDRLSRACRAGHEARRATPLAWTWLSAGKSVAAMPELASGLEVLQTRIFDSPGRAGGET